MPRKKTAKPIIKKTSESDIPDTTLPLDEEKKPKKKYIQKRAYIPVTAKREKDAPVRPPWRPRRYDRYEEADELLKWVALETSMNVAHFANHRGYPAEYLHDWSTEEDQYFGVAYRRAKSIVGERREKMAAMGAYDKGIYHRAAGMYDPLLHRHEMSVKEKEAEFRKGSNAPAQSIVVNVTDYSKIANDNT